MILYIKNPKPILELINEYSKVEEYKMNKQKSLYIYILAMSNQK